MKKLLVFLLFGSSLFSATLAQAADAIATANLNFRQGPSTRYPAIGYVSAGQQLNVSTCSRNWCLVSFAGGGSGWTSVNYLAFKTGNYSYYANQRVVVPCNCSYYPTRRVVVPRNYSYYPTRNVVTHRNYVIKTGFYDRGYDDRRYDDRRYDDRRYDDRRYDDRRYDDRRYDDRRHYDRRFGDRRHDRPDGPGMRHGGPQMRPGNQGGIRPGAPVIIPSAPTGPSIYDGIRRGNQLLGHPQ